MFRLPQRLLILFTFLSQLFRLPLAFLLIDDIDQLNDYFIVFSLCIPIHFLTNEIILYKGFNRLKSINFKNDSFILSCIIITILYFLFFHTYLLPLFIFYSISILIYNVCQYFVRENINVYTFIKYEFLLNIIVSVFFIFLLLKFNENLSFLLIFFISIFNLVVSLFILARLIREKLLNNIPEKQVVEGNYKIHVNLMIVTQLERLIISSFFPVGLSFIVLVSTFVEAMRRLIYDDSQLFMDIKNKYNRYYEQLIDNKFTLYIKGYFFFIFFSVPVYFIIVKFNYWTFFLDDFNHMPIIYSVFIIYCISSPPGIIVINFIRTGFYPRVKNAYHISILYIIFYSSVLILIKLELMYFYTIYFLVVIFMSTLLNNIFFYNLCKEYYSKFYKYIYFHITLCFIVIFYLGIFYEW